jgi:hypothetical protein
MDSEEKQIIDGFIKWAKNITKGSILFEGTIKSVDETKFNCVVTVSGNSVNTDILNVPLKVLIGSQASVIEIPAVGSDCTVCYRDNNIQRPQLVAVDKSDKLLIKIGNDSDGYQTLQVTKDGFVFNGGTHGMVKADELKTQSEKDKDILDGFLQVLQTPINEPGNGAPSAFQAALIAAIGTKQSGVWTGLENDKIKQ